jgi:hypothetical protein
VQRVTHGGSPRHGERLPELVVGYAVRMRRVAIVIALIASGGAFLAGCGGGQGEAGRPATLTDLGKWLGDESGGCSVGVEEARASSPSSPAKGSPSAIKPFGGEATFGGRVTCETWLSGWISYYEFPSAGARKAAVRGRAPFRRNHFYCAKGRELVVNELLGYDYTADFCRRLGFPIHHPIKKAQNHS